MAEFDLRFLKSQLAYDPKTGVFVWKVGRGGGNHRMKPGDRAGSQSGTGHRHVSVAGRKYLEHRLAFAFVHGYMPPEVDHKNGIENDNRIDNLRAATHQQNIANGKHRINNTSGLKGIRIENGRWRAKIMVRRKTIHLGSFASADEAHAAYMNAATHYFGEFARSS